MTDIYPVMHITWLLQVAVLLNVSVFVVRDLSSVYVN